ncbi:zinc ribbon domain-containing protein [candidate division WOR-3 bacterium]|uniref:Zinc ribbon domain-containing protein n=1 Tax=candidate division WOR-3 bacterium TaxID=2052148 RepID=A0A937XKQ5_UNCW3|nr:zinc ribbon domain-containing protein [candidate division WOR-3 bacterium]
MPIREFSCSICNHEFEELVLSRRDEEEIVCPKCGTQKLTRCFSSFAVAGAEKRVSSSSKSCGSCSSYSCSTCS